MIDLEHPAPFYFDACRRIEWCRLSYDKLFSLYSEGARDELVRLWVAALRAASPFLDGKPGAPGSVPARDALERALRGIDKDWRFLAGVVEGRIDMPQAINEYFLGVDPGVIVGMMRDSEYDAGAQGGERA